MYLFFVKKNFGSGEVSKAKSAINEEEYRNKYKVCFNNIEDRALLDCCDHLFSVNYLLKKSKLCLTCHRTKNKVFVKEHSKTKQFIYYKEIWYIKSLNKFIKNIYYF